MLNYTVYCPSSVVRFLVLSRIIPPFQTIVRTEQLCYFM